MTLVSSHNDKCKRGQHSFESVNHIPDFEHQCYMIQFQCEYCEFEVFGNIIKQKPVVCKYTCKHELRGFSTIPYYSYKQLRRINRLRIRNVKYGYQNQTPSVLKRFRHVPLYKQSIIKEAFSEGVLL
jgi:hypothetical protein